MKTRVEKLCQAFENGKELVELSQSSPHDISNVLKLYLRQVKLTSLFIASISSATDPKHMTFTFVTNTGVLLALRITKTFNL